MRLAFIKIVLALIILNHSLSAFSQINYKSASNTQAVLDSLKSSGFIFSNDQKHEQVRLTKSAALKFLEERTKPHLWVNTNDPLRLSLLRLIFEASHPPVDSLKEELNKFPFDSLSVPWNKFYIWEPLHLRVPVISKSEFKVKTDSLVGMDSVQLRAVSDSALIQQRKLNELLPVSATFNQLKDTTILVVIDTLDQVKSSYRAFPFKYYSRPYQSDSLKAAVGSLVDYLDSRDSVIINVAGSGNSRTPVMLNSRSETVKRYWLRNELSDSITLWIATPSRKTISLYPEQGIGFRRPGRQANYSKPKINVESIDNSKLLELQNIKLKSPFWKYRTEASFVLSQAALSNWVKGGENSISTSLDITGYADYNNKDLKLSSNNFARLKYGYLKSGSDKIKKNIDLLETNSKLNHKAFGKFDFSAILLFKTQIATGMNYFKTTDGRDTSNMVSKFMNPAVLTIGLGLDYKPNKTTSLNLSPLSYKGTFVTDPAYYHGTYYPDRIDQTQYGIAKDKKALNEPGASFMITNEFKPVESVTIVNRLQLFTNYIHNPQNVDVDWEMIATAKLNWFTDVRLNTHLIFDDDTKTDKVIDGVTKKLARIQFKEVLGFSLFFRF